MSFRRLAGGFLLVVILTIVGYWAYLQFLAPLPEETDVPATLLEAGNDDVGEDVISAEGEILPLRSAVLSFQTPGQVAEIFFRPGEPVRLGDPLVRLQATEPEIRFRQSQAGLDLAQANLDMANAGVEAAQGRVASAIASLASAQAQLALVLAAPQPEEVAIAESNIAIAAANIAQAEASRDVTLEIPQAQVRAAEARVAAALAEKQVLQDQYDALIRNGIGGSPEEQARYALNAATANVNAAQAALDELNAGATGAQRRAAQAAVSVAEAQHLAAQAQLDLLLVEAREEQVAVLEAGVAQAQATLTQAEAAVTQAEASVAQAQAAVQQAESVLELARAELDKTTLNAPYDGFVADVTTELGETVAPGLPVMTVANNAEWLVETTDLTELDVVGLATGLQANIRVDAFPDVQLAGTVTRIAPLSTLARGDVTYVVTIRLQDATELPLRWGMTAFVDINLQP